VLVNLSPTGTKTHAILTDRASSEEWVITLGELLPTTGTLANLIGFEVAFVYLPAVNSDHPFHGDVLVKLTKAYSRASVGLNV
jgi:hypothetical protein